MPPSVNKVIFIGCLGVDPELKYTGAGKAVCNMSVATNRSWKDPDGTPQERTDWHRVVVWGKQAENCHKYLVKGQKVYIEGRLETNKWEDGDGNNRYTTQTVAKTVIFLEKPKGVPAEQPPPEDDYGDDDIPF